MIDYLHPKNNNYTIKIEGARSLHELQECKDKIKLLFIVELVLGVLMLFLC